MKRLLSFTGILIFVLLSGRGNAQYVYTIKADSVKITNCDSAELIIENHTQGIPGFLFNTGNGRTQFRRALVALTDSTYLIGADTLKLGPQYWAANGTHIYNLNSGNVGIRRSQPGTTLDLPGAINIDDTSSYQVNYHPMIRVGDLESNVYLGLYVGDSSGKNTAGMQNTDIGGFAGYGAAGDGNTNVGTYAGYGMQVPPENPSLGQDNTCVGFGAGTFTVGGQNTYLGSGTGESYNGSFNTITGAADSYSPITGDFNSIYGAGAGGNDAGSPNCYFGYQSGNTTNGSNNVCMGTTAGSFMNEGTKNVIIGDSSCNGYYGFIAGDFNTVLGANSGIGFNTNFCTLVGSGSFAVSGVNNSTALGEGASVNTSNTMVFGNSAAQTWLFGVSAPVSGRALVVGSSSNNGNGAYLTTGGVWTNASDRAKKENFQPLDNNDLLARIDRLPVTRWNYKGLHEEHIGPVAQDFYRIFQVGSDDKAISTIDPSGVALAGIQGLHQKIKDQQAEIDTLKARLEKQQDDMNKVMEKLNAFEAMLKPPPAKDQVYAKNSNQ